MVIHLFAPEWRASTLVYRIYQNRSGFESLAMRREDGNWWVASLAANRLEFSFASDRQLSEPGTEKFRASAPEIWVQDGLIYTSKPGQAGRVDAFTALSLNMHTYQEGRNPAIDEAELTEEQAQERVAAYGPVYDRVVSAISKLDPDIVCLQEVGEWSGRIANDSTAVTFGTSTSNMVHQLLQRLDGQRYYYTMDWSHYGFDVWLEGSAILSKHPLSSTGARFISDPDRSDRKFWKSRNVPMAQIELGELGKVNVFSVHTGWWDDEQEPFQSQFERLSAWAREVSEPDSTTVFCGDFNLVAGSKEQQFMTNGTGYSDQYALANPDGLLDATVSVGIDGWENSTAGERIDYILINDDSQLEVRHSQRIFTQEVFGRVSDHTGVYAEFGKRNREPETTPGIAGLQLYLSGSFTGERTARGLRFEHMSDGSYRLITMLGAAAFAPKKGLLPHRLLITDRSGAGLSLGSSENDGEVITLDTTIRLSRSRNEMILSLEKAGLFRFDLDYAARTLTIRRLPPS